MDNHHALIIDCRGLCPAKLWKFPGPLPWIENHLNRTNHAQEGFWSHSTSVDS